MKKLLTLILISMLIVGCKSTKVFTPTFLKEKNNLVLLEADSEYAHGIFQAFDERLYISEINGKSAMDFLSYPEKVMIEEGYNEIELHYAQGQVSGFGCVAFTAEIGKKYLAKKERESLRVKYWVIEQESGTIVSNIGCVNYDS
jgi:hypothetical protein